MADPRFFQRAKPLSLSQIAAISGAELSDPSSGDFMVTDVASLDRAGVSDISFLDNINYKIQFMNTNAGACFVVPELATLAPKTLKCMLSKNPYKSYALTAQAFYPKPEHETSISKKACIANTAKIGKSCAIAAGVVIGENVEIGDHTSIAANTVIGDGVIIGEHCKIGANVTITHALIGSYVSIYTGVRIGQDGFGFAIDPAGHIKVPQLGRVIIEDHVEIGANTTIDRGAGPDTVIGHGTWIDNLVQIGHNVKIGRGCVIVAQVGISGSTELEDYVVLGGQVGIAGHLKIGKRARIAAQSGIMRDVPDGAEYMGTPALPLREFMRQTVTLKRLIQKDKK